MTGKDPLRVTLVQLLALMGNTYSDKGEAQKDGREIYSDYDPEADPPVRRRDKKPMTADDFDEKVHKAMKTILFGDTPQGKVAGMVIFECGDFDSSHHGERKGLVYGPDCTYKTLDEIWWYDKKRKQVNMLDAELASTIKVPICYYEKDPKDDPCNGPAAAGEPATAE